MPSEPRRLYWDANVFLSYIEGVPDRLATIGALLADAAAERDVEIYTSALSITEVAYAASERMGAVLSQTVEAAIDDLWQDPTIKLIEFNTVIARDARRLVRESMLRNVAQQLPSLRPADAIHIATALWINASEVMTYDTKLLNQNDLVGIVITKPYLAQPRLIP